DLSWGLGSGGGGGQGQTKFVLTTQWVLALAMLTLLPGVGGLVVPLRVGVVGPWNCDPLFAKALPEAAAKLAVDRINREAEGHRVLEYTVLPAACQTSKALADFAEFEERASVFLGPVNPGYCEAASLLGKNWDKGVFSWACANSDLNDAGRYPTFSRVLPSPVRVLFNVLKFFRWAHVGVVSSNEDIWVDTANKVANALRSRGLPVGIITNMGFTDQDLRDSNSVRVIIMCMHSVLIGGEEQTLLLHKAQEMGLTDGRYVFVPYDTLLYSLPYRNTSHPVLRADSKLREAYNAVLTITVQSEERSFQEAFEQAKDDGELLTPQGAEQVSPLFGTIYNGVYLIAKAMGSPGRSGGRPRDTRNLDFQGFNQRIRTDAQGNGLSDYVVLDADWSGQQLVPTYTVDPGDNLLVPTGNPIRFPGGAPPQPDPNCWFDPNNLCTGGEASLRSGYFLRLIITTIIITIIIITIIIVITINNSNNNNNNPGICYSALLRLRDVSKRFTGYTVKCNDCIFCG
uniref:Receptor ligand binding region domain-containing protein n=1 Tax=Callorhinchus milii TaxID=7868 RepID=A0A4W3HBU0_CALMI